LAACCCHDCPLSLHESNAGCPFHEFLGTIAQALSLSVLFVPCQLLLLQFCSIAYLADPQTVSTASGSGPMDPAAQAEQYQLLLLAAAAASCVFALHCPSSLQMALWPNFQSAFWQLALQ
jgi:hypothetical protein